MDTQIFVRIKENLKNKFMHTLLDKGDNQKNVIESAVQDYIKKNGKPSWHKRADSVKDKGTQ